MKKIFLLAIISTVSVLAFVAVISDWELEKKELDNGKISYILNYTENRGKPLVTCLKEIDRNFNVHLLLLTEQTEIQKDLRAYYKKNLRNELRKALNSSLTLTSPLLNPLRNEFESALKSTFFYKRLEEALEKRGFKIEKKISFKKFMIFKKEGDYFFHADIFLKVIPKK